MADDDSRRGVASVGDADSGEQSTNSGDNLQVKINFVNLQPNRSLQLRFAPPLELGPDSGP
jgi:hypothetical protein